MIHIDVVPTMWYFDLCMYNVMVNWVKCFYLLLKKYQPFLCCENTQNLLFYFLNLYLLTIFVLTNT